MLQMQQHRKRTSCKIYTDICLFGAVPGIRLFGGHFNEKRYEEERTHQRYCRRLQRRPAAGDPRVQYRLGEHGAHHRRARQRCAGIRHDRAGHGGRTQRPDHGRGRGGSGSDLSAARPLSGGDGRHRLRGADQAPEGDHQRPGSGRGRRRRPTRRPSTSAP